MPSRRTSAQKPRLTKPRRSAARPRRRAHLLIIECDSRQLASGGLNLGRPFAEFLKALFRDKCIAFVETSSEPELARDLARVFKEHGRFRSILRARVGYAQDNWPGRLTHLLAQFHSERCQHHEKKRRYKHTQST